MNLFSKLTRNAWMLIAAFGLLIALSIAPTTGWIARSQIAQAFGIRGTTSAHDSASAETARRYANDCGIQVAYAEQAAKAPANESDPAAIARYVLASLRGLQPRWPNSPLLDAACIEQDTLFVTYHRDMADYLGTPPPAKLPNGASNSNKRSYIPPDPRDVTALIRDCQNGERSDPDNAYFSLMLAYGLFAAERDTAAMEAIHRAARKPHWNEYKAEQVLGQCRLHDLSTGSDSPISHLTLQEDSLFPEINRMRQTARLAVWMAICKELNRQTEEGLSIRYDIVRCGVLMRDQSTTLIGAMTGKAIASIGLARLGGAPKVENAVYLPAEQANVKYLNAFYTYLRTTNHKQDLPIFQRALGSGDRVIQNAVNSMNRISLKPYYQVGVPWITGTIVLDNALWMLILGALIALSVRRGQILNSAPLSVSTRNLILAGVALVVLYSVVGILMLQEKAGIADRLQLLSNLMGQDIPHPEFAIPVLLMSIPLLLSIGLVIASLVRRQPVSVGVMRGFHRFSIPVACSLILIYGGVMAVTVWEDASANTQVYRTTQNEGRYDAEASGSSWFQPADWSGLSVP